MHMLGIDCNHCRFNFFKLKTLHRPERPVLRLLCSYNEKLYFTVKKVAYAQHNLTNLKKINESTDKKFAKFMLTNSELESALCGDANPRRLQRQSCCG